MSIECVARAGKVGLQRRRAPCLVCCAYTDQYMSPRCVRAPTNPPIDHLPDTVMAFMCINFSNVPAVLGHSMLLGHCRQPIHSLLNTLLSSPSCCLHLRSSALYTPCMRVLHPLHPLLCCKFVTQSSPKPTHIQLR